MCVMLWGIKENYWCKVIEGITTELGMGDVKAMYSSLMLFKTTMNVTDAMSLSTKMLL